MRSVLCTAAQRCSMWWSLWDFTGTGVCVLLVCLLGRYTLEVRYVRGTSSRGRASFTVFLGSPMLSHILES